MSCDLLAHTHIPWLAYDFNAIHTSNVSEFLFVSTHRCISSYQFMECTWKCWCWMGFHLNTCSKKMYGRWAWSCCRKKWTIWIASFSVHSFKITNIMFDKVQYKTIKIVIFHIWIGMCMCFFFLLHAPHYSVGITFIGFQNVLVQHKMVSRNHFQYAISVCLAMFSCEYFPFLHYNVVSALISVYSHNSLVVLCVFLTSSRWICCSSLFFSFFSSFDLAKEIRKKILQHFQHSQK